ncbi:hypothetical protein O6P43_028344 [Quillaja saponaria]|uniref:Uncharacterized protein n=1 Tax=Quillaja saponaria TaxID=32244 RepID=A0AAD7KXM5_QUISA|nr:hypothetical protein O6P43_028344 [Quillaja saponaria]
MADHDLRRKASNLKRHRSQTREGVHANQEMGRQRSLQILLGEIKGEVDLASLHDLSYSDLDLTAAKAA